MLCLPDAESEWPFDDLAANLSTVETVTGAGLEPDAEAVLHHRHLPVLERTRLIETDDTFRRIRRGENFEPVRAMVAAAVEAIP